MSEPDRVAALLERPGLDSDERLLVIAKAAVWPGDHARLADCLALGRDRGMRREWFEEVLLQAILFCGFPRVINAFRVFTEQWPPGTPPCGGSLPAEEQRRVGDELFATIYGENSASVAAMLQSYHGELHEFVLDTAYGRILSRPGLTPRVRELLAVGVLALTGQIPQLIAHGRGALRFGADPEQVSEAIYTTTADAALAEKSLRRIR